MAWQLPGRSMELCSCKMLCPCWLGPEGVPDQGWCGGALGFDIERGSSDGVDLSGTRVALAAEWLDSTTNQSFAVYPFRERRVVCSKACGGP